MNLNFPQTFSSIVINSDGDFDEEWKDFNCAPCDRQKLHSIFKLISYPITLFIEIGYVDKVYRDSYYTFFSNKHINFERNCKRLSIFRGVINQELLSDFSLLSEKNCKTPLLDL